MPLLEVKDIHARVVNADKSILQGLSLSINPGEVHAIMGPNGSGKSTLANVLAGRPDYELTSGEIRLAGEDISALLPEERAVRGLFLAFQYPAEIPGVRPWQFLKASVDAIAEYRGEKKLGVREFTKVFEQAVKEVAINPELSKRSLNEGFSGGEKKRNEMLQMKILQPRLCVMDETDSGLDIDALKTVAAIVNGMRSPERSFLIVTHYQRILEHVTPDFVHILVGGRIVKSGNSQLARELEKTGYERFIKVAAGA
ncbi:MAG: Fe-S cluster assembly ATPase SufC [SAR202 cluster bacterium]|nr:Fe-S cluster assembly ATPase SufC [SAR202 cluster bacterium]